MSFSPIGWNDYRPKTSFFTAFRKLEGMTPTEYLQKKK